MLIRYSEYEARSRKLVSKRTIWVTALACLVFGIFNIDMASWSSVAAILAACGICVVALVANHKDRVRLANIMVCASILIAITYSIYDGDGLLDPGIIGYALFILIGTLLLEKRYTIWLTLASIVSLLFIGYMQVHGYLHMSIHPNDASNLVPIIIFLVIGALVVWVIQDNMDGNLLQLKESDRELRESYALTIQGLSRALDVRDVDTGGHSHRVVDLTVKLAQAMGISEKDIEYMRYGAYLHDIGKIGIPDAILFKKELLTDEEWKIMRTHTLLADDVLASIPYLIPALDIPKYHHEHWDGNGYPHQLSGTQIPLAARIFAVVDVWDALTNARPYRDAWPHDRARNYIAHLSGKQFDPLVVSSFLKVLDTLK